MPVVAKGITERRLMKSYSHSDEYLKGYKRGLRGALFSESVLEAMNLHRMLFLGNNEIKERDQGYEDGLREHDAIKWEYETGFNRGTKGKDSQLSPGEVVSFDRIFFQTNEAEHAREDGYKEGLKARDYKRWG